MLTEKNISAIQGCSDPSFDAYVAWDDGDRSYLIVKSGSPTMGEAVYMQDDLLFYPDKLISSTSEFQIFSGKVESYEDEMTEAEKAAVFCE